jgi:hypothetical protein
MTVADPIRRGLGLSADVVLSITGVAHEQWGRTLRLMMQADDAERLSFALVFEDCREIKWRIFVHQADERAVAFPQTTLVDFAVGRGQHRSPATLLSDHFGLTLVYGRLVIVHDGRRHTLD